ncbi:MAG TPA: FHA domain-containing protein [Ruminococcus sp.]|nr:FHA domain-containing protein [Ruminococcus sp.]
MSIDTFLIICFAVLLVLIGVSFAYFFAVYRKRDIISGDERPAPAPVRKPQPQRAEVPSPQQKPAPQQAAPPPADMIKIKRLEDNAVFDIDLSRGPVTLGRLSSCTDRNYYCVSSMADVSKRHCTLTIGSNGRVIITDNGSTNHTYVNGRRTDGVAVMSSGDRFSLGQTCEFIIL